MGLSRGVCFRREEYAVIDPNNLRGANVLVIGASGFLGGRLVERLVLEQGARVTVLVRRVMSAATVARLPVDVTVGSILDLAAVTQAARGSTVIFNCARGTGADRTLRRAVDVDGVRHVVEAAQLTGARVVHVSTMAVYDLPREGDVDESTSDAPSGDPYSDAKLKGERLALELGRRHRVPVVVVQPTVIYGPNAGVHGTEIIHELRTSRVLLIDGGTGLSNAVYVDDVVTALLLAAVHPDAPGERFLISGPEYPTWAEFFGAFEQMLGVKSTVSMSQAEAIALWHTSRKRSWLLPEALHAVRTNPDLRDRLLATRDGALMWRATARVWNAVLPALPSTAGPDAQLPPVTELPLAPARPWLVQYLASRPRVKINKARQMLEYEPVFTLQDGMRLTEQWSRWAGLLS